MSMGLLTSLAYWSLLVLGQGSVHCFTAAGNLVNKKSVIAPTRSSKLHQTSSSTSTMRLVGGVREIVDDFDVFLLDMWGVMHDGHNPYSGVLEVIQRLKQAGKRMIILSNSSKRQDNSVRMLKKLGFDPSDFDQIITSGEVAFDMLTFRDTAPRWEKMAHLVDNKKCFILGSGDGDEEYCTSAGWSIDGMEQAELIIARGVFTINDGSTVIHKREDAALYESTLKQILQEAATRRLPMLVCNPDKIRPDAERPPMPGRIGDDYEQALGGGPLAAACVKRIGKPIADVYDLALKDITDRSRVCMVGDALETDVAGGDIAGISSLWVLKDGVYGPELADVESLESGAQSVLETFNAMDGTYAAGRQLSPELLIPHFRW